MIGRPTGSLVFVVVAALATARHASPNADAAEILDAPPTSEHAPKPVDPLSGDEESTLRAALADLGAQVIAAPTDRKWEQRYEALLSVLAASRRELLVRATEDPTLDSLQRRLAAIALDRKESPRRHTALDRYRRSDADLARSEGRTIVSLHSVNNPPRLLPEHASVEHRRAWESLLLGSGWWQSSEFAADVLDSMDSRPSSEVLVIALRRAVVGFDRNQDQGWRERTIIRLVSILGDTPDRAVLEGLSAAFARCPDAALREKIVFVVVHGEAWRPIVVAAALEHASGLDHTFLERVR